jgi:hypothetical protein
VKYQGDISLKNQYTLKKLRDRKVKEVLSRCGYHWEEEGNRESEGE